MRLRYFISQLKRALKAAFHVFSFMLLLALCVALAASLFSASEDGRKQEIRIGVTGATEDSI
ncbi:MAG: hypothetical protein II689_05100, partial [Firmicutes bacterium]|nr:hypothetical protein [Bacillota bacterium]